MDRLGVGFVGAGFVVDTFHLPSFSSVRYADVEGITSLSMDSAKESTKLARDLGVGDPKAYTDVQEMVRNDDIDAVWIATPNYTRVPVTEQIVEEVSQGRSDLVGVVCEKPLARNVEEAERMTEMVNKEDLLHGYLENNTFMPSILKGKSILWERGAERTGRPYIARCAEEHSGPHEPWFWDGEKQGGGTVSDMGCHSHEAARFLLTGPEEVKDDLDVLAVNGEIHSLKWTRSDYVDELEEVHFKDSPVEDFGRTTVTYELPTGDLGVAEIANSWNFMGPGIRFSFELLGPEYSMEINSLDTELSLFFSREVVGERGEDLLEKQEAEQGQMPVIPNEPFSYGYVSEDKHMVKHLREGKMPRETWEDGEFVVKLLMTSYKSAEEGKKLKFPPKNIEEFKPQVAEGTWDPKETAKGHPK